jgi:hypothetical protein
MSKRDGGHALDKTLRVNFIPIARPDSRNSAQQGLNTIDNNH